MNDTDLGIEGLTDFQEIGSGGFATVYAATEADYGRRVAVKVFTAIDDAGRRRFDRERLAMGQASAHPNIVTPLRGGSTPGGRPYLVMEYMAGGSLDEVVANGPIPWDEAVNLITPIADALHHAHQEGITHKDIKPANILLTKNNTPKLSDFGIAAIRETTSTQQLAYTLLYTPPETFTNQHTDTRDHRSDLYSLAATLYALGTGQPPFTATNTAALINNILTNPPPPTNNPTLDTFFTTALAKHPNQRHQTANQLHTHLQQLTTTTPTTGTTTPATPPPTPQPTATTGGPHASGGPGGGAGSDETDGVGSGPGRRRVLAAAATVAVLGIGGAVAAVGLGSGDDDGDGGATTSVAPTATTTATQDDTGTPGPADPDPGAAAVEVTDATIVANHRPGPVPVVTELRDGRLASGGVDGTVRIWDPDDPATTEATYTGHTGRLTSVVELADGRIISAAGVGELFTENRAPSIHLWDPDNVDTTLAVYAGHRSTVRAMVQLADGQMASIDAGGSLHLWDHADPATTIATYDVADITTDDGVVWDATALADGRLAVASGTAVDVWDPGDPVADPISFTGHDDAVVAVIELGTGQLASVGTEVHLWRTTDPTAPEATWSVAGVEPRSVAELGDRRLLVGDGGGVVHLWDPATGDTAEAFTDHTGGVLDIEQLGDGRVASADAGGAVVLWSPADPTATTAYTGHVGPVGPILQLDDGRIASSGEEDTVQVWSASAPRDTIAYDNDALVFPPVYSLAQFTDGRVAFASTSDGALHLWDPDDPSADTVLSTGEVGPTDPLVQLGDGRILAAAADGGISIWSLDDPGAGEVVYDGHDAPVDAMIELPDGRIASGDSAGALHLWHPDGAETTAVIRPPDGGTAGEGAEGIEVLLALDDGRIVLAGDGGRITVWDPASPSGGDTFDGHVGAVVALVVLGDGRVASASVDGTVQIWSTDEPDSAEAFYQG
ncbi:MAG: WD40 repeat domain-containing serine/threonine-protein kinase, partial [Actinomycetota bacterium]